MIYRLIGIVVVWLTIWFVVWRVFYGPMARRRINYVDGFLWTSAFFLIVSALIVMGFRDVLLSFAGGVDAVPFVVFGAMVLVQIVLYRVAARRLRRPVTLIEQNPREMFLRLDFRYLISKSFEVLFQKVNQGTPN